MAALKNNGSEIARFERKFDQEDGWVLIAQRSVRLKVFSTKPAQVRVLQKVRMVNPFGGSRAPWTSWKMVATARTRQTALQVHDDRGWTQLSGDRDRGVV